MSLSHRLQLSALILLFILHAIWIVNHLRWVAGGQIDPWKLGGYGMYTIPPPSVGLVINKVSRSGMIQELDPAGLYLREFARSIARTNAKRVFRCAPVLPESIRAFFDGNPALRGIDLIFVFTEIRLSRDPVLPERGEQGRVQVQWIGDRNLVFASQFCGGDVVTGEVSWS